MRNFEMNRLFSRRTILRGAGVALTLPWMESLAPKAARAADTIRKRYLPIYLPNGTADFWTPSSPGAAAAWKLSSILEPLTPLKSKVTVLTNMENGSSFNGDSSSSVEPSHGRQPGAWLTCFDPGAVRAQLGLTEANYPSVDQRIAKFLKGQTPFDSLQVGLSTTASFCDSQPCSNSRTVSWNDKNLPMYKLVDPLEVFNKLVGVAMPTMPGDMPDPELQKRLIMNKSVLDAVINNTNATRALLGKQDQDRLDDFLEAVREVELKATSMSSGMGGLACTPIAKPTMSDPNKPVNNNNYARQNSATYNKGTHADVMNDLIVMAFQCDATRVITYMLEDERSEFAYDHVTRRSFTQAGSTEVGGTCPEYHNGGQHGDPNDFATITWWNVGKVAALCSKLDGISEGSGTLLDNTLVMFGSCMHGSDHACNRLPLTLIGSGGGTFKTDQHVQFDKRWLRDLHHTVMTRMYGMTGADVDSFGVTRANLPKTEIKEILAV
jgi:Protein of unknown function (DUF1552)